MLNTLAELFLILLMFAILLKSNFFQGGEAYEKQKALSKEGATSRKSTKKIINDYILTRLGVKSK